MNAKIPLVGVIFLLCIAAVQAANLTVTNLDVSVTYPAPYDRYSDRDDTDDDIVDGAAIKADIYPGSIVEFTFDARNDFPSSSDTDIDNIVATVTAEDLNDGDDVEEESIDFDLAPGDEERVRISIPVPEKVEAKEYNVKILVEGDANSSNEFVELNIKMDVKKESHDLKIISLSAVPDQVSCDRSIVVKATLANLGRNEESNAALEVSSNEIGLYKKQEGISLDQDPFVDENEYSLSVPFTVSKDQKAGRYPISIRALFQNTFQMDSRQVPITVKDCGTAAPQQKPQENPEGQGGNTGQQATEQQVSTQTGQSQPQPVAGSQNPDQVYSSVEKPFLSTPYGRWMLIVGNIVLLAAIIYIGARFISGRSRKKGGEQQENEQSWKGGNQGG